MRIVYRLVGYSRETDRRIASCDVPQNLVQKAKEIAGIGADDDGCGDYPLDDRQARKIAKLTRMPVTLKTAEYFLEPYVFEIESDDATH